MTDGSASAVSPQPAQVRRATHPHVALVVGLAVTLGGGWWKTDADKSRQIAELQARSADLPQRRDRELDQNFSALRTEIRAVQHSVDGVAARVGSIEQHLRRAQ